MRIAKINPLPAEPKWFWRKCKHIAGEFFDFLEIQRRTCNILSKPIQVLIHTHHFIQQDDTLQFHPVPDSVVDACTAHLLSLIKQNTTKCCNQDENIHTVHGLSGRFDINKYKDSLAFLESRHDIRLVTARKKRTYAIEITVLLKKDKNVHECYDVLFDISY
ncbi:hypothetical protein FUT69_01590 [Xylella taiwanensis]|uniref:Uncharacterized protein n=1 Tax=Xylella taiwanensis TaxID=1444770 RepID=Z9JKJ7_9GAMM|nr:hypothetical protein [Xylella taiwanensis]AXI84175.1 hypothetical protein AB672_09625 [Xylella taiwanensis]EWS78930.1 hypothetical protein AF72_03230 [Xylella taiwanensis]MCD8457293.1 hypothetical protein [Xylella taiwanensis]MCD8459703.1 hypothetical protein [Xylella taiwanensis]MCD8461427.1 hypothetical protein [Xylella taiwanensis]